MAQQAIRKMKRKQGTNGSWLLKGTSVAVAATVVLVIVFAVIIGLTDMEDGLIRIINQGIKVLSVFLGVRAAVSPGSDNAIRRGVVIGLVYMGVGLLLYGLLSGQQMTVLSYVLDVLMGVAAGGLSGMLVGSMQGK